MINVEEKLAKGGNMFNLLRDRNYQLFCQTCIRQRRAFNIPHCAIGMTYLIVIILENSNNQLLNDSMT
jgi:hypothetical protein